MSSSSLKLDPARCRAARCRSCGTVGLLPVLDLGQMPLSDRLVNPEATAGEPRYPLEVVLCPECALVQIMETVPPEVVFDEDYPYFSSYSTTLLEHSKRHAEALIGARGLGPQSLVVELASNDGYMLKNFKERGIEVLGIDPAPGPARVAQENGIETLCEFFTIELARKVAVQGQRADVIIANNVLAHVADTNGFVQGIAALLADDGMLSVEAPYLRDLVKHLEFDTIYHEHLCYFSVTSVAALFRRNGLYLNEVRWLPIHGGSLRYYAGHQEQPSESVAEFLEQERELGMLGQSYYADFAERVGKLIGEVRELLFSLAGSGSSIAAYGAAAKGAILLNALGEAAEKIDFVVDRNPYKQGKLMPGTHTPILAPEALLERRPDYTLILPWNLADEIIAQQGEYSAAGGRFIVPIPTPRVVDAAPV